MTNRQWAAMVGVVIIAPHVPFDAAMNISLVALCATVLFTLISD
jgi:hypothetical protein